MVHNTRDRREEEDSDRCLSCDETAENLRLRGEVGEMPSSWIESQSGGEMVENRRLRGDIGAVWCVSAMDVVVCGRTIERLRLRGESLLG